ncbi:MULTISPECIES: STAS domain-containing protein [Pseudomonas]|uniref:STAS domain-containing protein n=1 Tax=Pseudomonas fluorescens TaxID=294 RepID=A0A944DHV7_PSEFL|nr:STAS domain-containing protein [Pseudomonas fluorescens]MBT2295623.1 STAS domain-containing protein [Pseudomonas fluorescens]MBT2310477.1 STAS domain-containing protein [Pseudomonas fluorescens]MBT2313985.1 STAS domain-containing protein [Pseudomonas fluorescens]MBT2318701.1 STAS domain-containing protein [Pseudomonas fluorescens]MBT2329521.1 STAS domain-containing protein [Pseudomonas fluorescens]
MPLLYETQDDTAQVQIDGELTIYTVADLAAQWLPHLGATPRMALDLSQITEMDGAGLQLLLMVQREAPKAGTRLQITGQSKAVIETLALCNLVA